MKDEKVQRTAESQEKGDYADILDFAKAHSGAVSFREFRTHAGLRLFALPSNYDFDALAEILGRIKKALPAVKRIFARPILRLKDTDVIIPAEAVQVINNKTIIHASGHSELWENITEDGLKPRKLMTLNHTDTYAIYENIAFVKAVGIILRFISKNQRILCNVLYAHGEKNVNFLDNEYHFSYITAMDNLRIGYVRNPNNDRQKAIQCLSELTALDKVIRAKTNCKLYKQCVKKSEKPLTLKKTNIFRSQKDYHSIYTLLKWFADEAPDTYFDDPEVTADSAESYAVYCSMLSVFSAQYFNFAFDGEQKIDFFNMDAEASFKSWRLRLETLVQGESRVLRFSFSKDRDYRIILVPALDEKKGKEIINAMRESGEADEFYIADPNELGDGRVYLSLFEMESFCRVQQLLLRGMIFSDKKRDLCPFCGEPLLQAKQSDGATQHECSNSLCRMLISTLVCPSTQKAYTVTGIKNFRPHSISLPSAILRDKNLYGRYLSTRMHFRNITPINESIESICPHCGGVHS